MRKEILFAILAGVLFGLVIAFGIWRLNSSLSSNTPNNTQDTNQQPSNNTGELSISIAKPDNMQVFTSSSTTISGLTSPNAWVVISGEDKDWVTQADADGGFSQDVELIGGVNQMVLTAFDKNQNSAKTSLELVYSSEFPTPEASPSADTSTASDSVRQKVQEKVNAASNIPYAYIGTVTDISETTIQIKNGSGDIQQIQTADDTTYVNTTGSSAKSISFKDVAIGDFITAMGYVNQANVLDSKRILVMEAFTNPNRVAYLGQITKIDKKTVTLKLNDKDVDLTFPSSWKGPEIADLNEGDNLIAVVAANGSTNTVRTIVVANATSSSPTPSK
jgi:preprotein translocase subunit YajC